MRIELHTDDGAMADVTEAVQIVYDAMLASMDFGSGFLDTQEIEALRAMAAAAGWAPVEYGLDECATCGHRRDSHPSGRCYERVTKVAPVYVRRRVSRPDGTTYEVTMEESAGLLTTCTCEQFVWRDTPADAG